MHIGDKQQQKAFYKFEKDLHATLRNQIQIIALRLPAECSIFRLLVNRHFRLTSLGKRHLKYAHKTWCPCNVQARLLDSYMIARFDPLEPLCQIFNCARNPASGKNLDGERLVKYK